MSEDPLSKQHKGAKDQFQSLNLKHWGWMFPRVPGRERGILKHNSIYCYCGVLWPGRGGGMTKPLLIKEVW